MVYHLILTERARASLKALSPDVARRIVPKIERMRNDLAGDVKRLTNFEPAYRLRVGDWRVLFDVARWTIVVQDVKHRSRVYDA
jgi:mRNA interferase RelE/StbE